MFVQQSKVAFYNVHKPWSEGYMIEEVFLFLN
jgi:hypothetical protein